MGHEFDVFISYRRVGGDAIAQFLKQNLLRRRLRVFLDVSDLKSGHFGQAISSTIASTPNFVVVLTPGALDLCEDENDWLRREIAQAISAERNIIPILMPGFVYPKVLPKGVAGLSEFQAVSYSHEYADGAAAKLFGMLLRYSAKSWRWLWLTTRLSVFALSAIFGLRIFWKPVRQAPELTTKTAPPSVSSQPRLLAPPISMDPTSASKKEALNRIETCCVGSRGGMPRSFVTSFDRRFATAFTSWRSTAKNRVTTQLPPTSVRAAATLPGLEVNMNESKNQQASPAVLPLIAPAQSLLVGELRTHHRESLGMVRVFGF